MDPVRMHLKGLAPAPEAELAVLDVVLRHRPSTLFTNVGRCFYTPDAAVGIAQGVMLWQGFHQSLRPSTGRMLVNVDVSATAFYEPGKRSSHDLKAPLYDRDHAKLEKALKGLKIVVTHRGQIRRKYKIAALTAGDARSTTFSFDDQRVQTVYSYFSEKYGRNLEFPHMPLIQIGDISRQIFVPMEVCEIVPGQRHIRKLNERQFTCQPPHVRSNKISAGITILQDADDAYLKDFGVTLGKEMVNIPARVLPAPTISYHPASQEPTITPREGSWNLKDKMVAQGVSLVSWSVVVFGDDRDIPLSVCQNFITMLCQTCEECGVFVEAKQPPIKYANSRGDIEQTLIDAYIMAGKSYQQEPQLILCVMPNTGVPLYAEIKRVSDTVIGLATQCVQAKHLYHAKRQYCANVCLKMNVKLGGMNSYLANAQLPFVSAQPTLIIGADITHPALGSSGQSIAALVGSVDAQCSRYTASIRTQTGRMEYIQDISGMIVEIFRTFYQSSGLKPECIVVYRDGVSESQLQNVLDYELAAIYAGCDSLERGYRPKITYIAVQKRHHARFFPISKSDADRSGNILPGTVIESHITHPREFDFYLCSHPGLQGTSKPAHYHVLHDDSHQSSDVLQELSYRLCYLYCRATRSVSIVPPVYYAHLVATRARFHADGDDFTVVKKELSKVMYFM